MQASLFLIPVPLGETAIDKVLPPYNKEIISSIKHFIVENVRSARRFLKQTDPAIDIDSLRFYVLNKHTSKEELSGFLAPIAKGFSVGIISEAGCPAIADPGADIVAIAQQKGISISPLVGPSSILLALMASGFNGQSFAFNGYLPIKSEERTIAIKQAEQLVYAKDQTQLFIETPYRNMKLLEELVKTCKPTTRLCIAADITLPDEYIKTKTIAEWKKGLPDISKKPCIFGLYK